MERGDLTGALLDGRYRVLGPVAEGAMGVVYRAERVKLGRIVAIKVLHDVLPSELSGRKRFELEAMTMAKLEHPHCASVLDVGVHDDRPFVVMDFVSGQNLKELLEAGPLPVARASEIVRQVLSGLAHAHELGIIHRDIKPANLVLSHKAGLGDHVKILDFGLARLHDGSQNLTTGIVVGTPAYMAPEQIRGDELDHRVDLYACGVLLFELVTGEKPYHSAKDDPVEVCKMHLVEPIPRLDAKLPGVAFGELEAIVARALAKAPDDRYASAQEFAAALETAFPRRPSRPAIAPEPSAPGDAVPGRPPAEPSGPSEALPFAFPPAEAVGGLASQPISPRTTDDPVRAPSEAPPAGGDSSAADLLGHAAPPPMAAPDAAPVASPGSAPHGPPPLPVSRRTLLIAGGGIVAVVFLVAILAGGGAPPPPAPAPAVASGSASPPPPPDPAAEILAHADELVAQGDRDAALDLLNRSRRQHPDSAALAYAAGRIYFAKLYWTDGLRSFRDAIRNDPGYRSDPELIKTVLRGFITTPSYHEELADFLRDEIGSPAQPYLEETARDHPSATIRSRAAAELRWYP